MTAVEGPRGGVLEEGVVSCPRQLGGLESTVISSSWSGPSLADKQFYSNFTLRKPVWWYHFTNLGWNVGVEERGGDDKIMYAPGATDSTGAR